MASRWIVLLLVGAIIGCTEKTDERQEVEGPDPVQIPIKSGSPIEFEQVEDNIRHDTLLIQTTFDLKDGTFLMVASHALSEERLDAGDRNAGLRLYHYRLTADSSAQIISSSSSASDSWTMFPTFFKDPIIEGSYIVLANFGDRNSWGQKAIRFSDQGFEDLGFLNVAAIERSRDGDEEVIKLLNIAPQTRLSNGGNELIFTFEVQDLLLYDDLRGVLEQPINADRISYRWNSTDRMRLFIDGEVRMDQQPI